jgi:HAE1 family hydrophobic/amphiphilic exporter-1
MLTGSLALVGKDFIGFTFISNIDREKFAVNIDMKPSVTLYQNNQITMQVEKIIRKKPEVMRVYTNIGSTINRSSKNNAVSISVKMIDRDEWNIDVYNFSEQIKNEIMQQIPGIRARVGIMGLGGSDSNEPIQLIVPGADFEKVQSAANTVLNVIRRTPGTTDAKFSTDDPRQEVLTSSMVLTLVVVPAVYMGFYRVKAKFSKSN